jgi:ketosteroid isomerase-like protein
MHVAKSDRVRDFFDAWTGGDLETMLDAVHPDVEAHPMLGILWGSSHYRGRTGISQWFEDTQRVGERFEVHVEGIRGTRDAEVAFVRLVVREHTSAFDARVAVFCGFRDGRIVSLIGRDADEAAEAIATAAG